MLGRRSFLVGAGAAAALPVTSMMAAAAPRHYALVVYGATPSGIMAAIAAARLGVPTLLIFAEVPLGGMVAQGLCATDVGREAVLGGLARDFFTRCGQSYGAPLQFQIEPHVAADLFERMLSEYPIDVLHHSTIDRVMKSDNRIEQLSMTDGTTVRGFFFVDASYTGDLMAAAAVSYVVGRESDREYGEAFAGFGKAPLVRNVSPLDASGRLIYGLRPWPALHVGASDRRIQSYFYRLCLSNDPANRTPWQKPPGYDREHFALIARRLNPRSTFVAHLLPNSKVDLNGDVYGASWTYPEASVAARSAIESTHRLWQQGYLYFLATDPVVPVPYREAINEYGLARDEFVHSGHWPEQIYVREARRMVGATVMTQSDVQVTVEKHDSIGMGSYDIDIHVVGAFGMGDDRIVFEGEASPHDQALVTGYQIPARALLPQRREAENLAVSVCVSASHVALGSIRTEITYMIMGEAAGTAAALAYLDRAALPDLPIAVLQAQLRAQGAILET